MTATCERIKPELTKDGIPECSENCPSFDGKRCEIEGCRPHLLCRPAVAEMVADARIGRLVGVEIARLKSENERLSALPRNIPLPDGHNIIRRCEGCGRVTEIPNVMSLVQIESCPACKAESELANMTRQRDQHAHNLRCAVVEVERMRRHARCCAESMMKAHGETRDVRLHLGLVMRREALWEKRFSSLLKRISEWSDRWVREVPKGDDSENHPGAWFDLVKEMRDMVSSGKFLLDCVDPHRSDGDQQSVRMRSALERCRDKFREYEQLHTLKANRLQKGWEPWTTPEVIDRRAKAEANAAMAAMCDEALKR